MLKFRAFLLTVALASPSLASAAQAPQAPPPTQAPAPAASTTQSVPTVCGLPIPAPANLPPAGSAPVVYLVVPCFQKQGGYSVVVSNAAGATPSSNATLVVTPPSSTLHSVAVSNAVDFVYDSARDLIYVTTPTAIQRYHAEISAMDVSDLRRDYGDRRTICLS